MKPLRVGAARVCIDPPASEYPFPSNFAMCDEIRDPCHVRAVAMENGETRILLVVYELSDIPGIADLEARLGEVWGIEKENVILCMTHNHSSPCDKSKIQASPEKFELFKKIELSAGIEAVKKAVASLKPARWGYGTVDSYCNVNRDLKTRFGFWVEGPNYTGYSNKKLACIKFVDENDRVIAAILNYGAHAVCAFLQKDSDGKMKSSSNFPGIACRFVEDYFGGDCVAVWTSGAAGNQDPLLFDYQWLEYPDGYVTKISLPDGSGYVHMDILGSQQGADAVTCLNRIRADQDQMRITYLRSTVPIPKQQRDPGFRMPPMGLRMGGVGPRKDFSPPKFPEFPGMVPTGTSVEYTLNLLMLDEVAVLLTSGELYAEIARDMMDALPVKDSFVITHIPGQGGYTLDKGSADHKTFQAFGGVKAGDADEPLRKRSVALVEQALRKQ